MKSKEKEGEHKREDGEELDPKAQGGREAGWGAGQKALGGDTQPQVPAELTCIFHSVGVSRSGGGLLKAAHAVSTPDHTDRCQCAATVHLTGTGIAWPALTSHKRSGLHFNLHPSQGK